MAASGTQDMAVFKPVQFGGYEEELKSLVQSWKISQKMVIPKQPFQRRFSKRS